MCVFALRMRQFSLHTWADGRTRKDGRQADRQVGRQAGRQIGSEGMETSGSRRANGLPRGLCWGEGEGDDEPDDLVLRGGTRACWAVREADGPCRGPWEVFMGGG